MSPIVQWMCALVAVVAVCCAAGDSSKAEDAKPQPGGKPVDMPGLHNVIHVSDQLYSGGVPEDDAGFDSLSKLGIKTILSVDGARPDVERAKKRNMRYVHLPIGYDGVSQEQALKLARAVRDLPGPIYLHCHHGKHRSPAAAAAVQLCLDDKCTASQAIEIMKRAGTDPKYAGLYGAPKELKRPTTDVLNQVKADYPEIAALPALAASMVKIDEYWDHLTLIRKNRWLAPKTHPDLDPPHEALQLWEHYRELQRLADIQKRPADFRKWLSESVAAAKELEDQLRAKATADELDKSFQRTKLLCTQCHAKYRDVPQKP